MHEREVKCGTESEGKSKRETKHTRAKKRARKVHLLHKDGPWRKVLSVMTPLAAQTAGARNEKASKPTIVHIQERHYINDSATQR